MSNEVSERAWKVADLLDRMATEDPYDLIRSEMDRLAGRLEARGLQGVRVNLRYDGDDDTILLVSIAALCPCGAVHMSSQEKWPLDMFRDGPHTFRIRLTMMERAITDHMDKPASKK